MALPISPGVSLGAPADEAMTFGYGRAEIVAALVNYTALILIAAYLAYEGIGG